MPITIDVINRYEIFKDTLTGAATFFALSTLNQMFSDNNDFVRLTGFLWAAPLVYFFLVNMFSQRGKIALYEFNKHAGLGLIFTFILLLITTLYMNDDNLKILAHMNFIVTIIGISIYLYLELYKKGQMF
jgi:hypothetical protein